METEPARNEVAEAIGDRIRKARTHANPPMTQEALARRVGVFGGTVREWEKGRAVPSGRHVYELCRVLGLEPNALFGWDADNDKDDQ